MLDSIPFSMMVGTVLGFLSGLGVGGGSLLLLWLTAVLDLDQQTARIINLLFFLPSAFIATLFRQQEGSLKWKPLLPAILCGCFAAAVSSHLGNYLPVAVLRKAFGFLLLLTGLRELFGGQKKERKP